jgi:hypothetical protein
VKPLPLKKMDYSYRVELIGGDNLKSLKSRDNFNKKKMKSLSYVLGSLVLTSTLMTSCGGASIKENEYLGKAPSMVKNYYEDIAEKEQELKENTKMENAFELQKEIELLEDEMDEAVEKYVNENPDLINKEVPVEALPDTKYTVNSATITRISTSVNLLFTLTMDEDLKNEYGGTEKSILFYFKAIDSEGKAIPEAISVATSFGSREPLVAGTKYEAKGSLRIENLEDFAKIVQITKEEYEKTK